MANIMVLDQNTINKIAAGEVIERPSSVVKELLENAIDARATAVTVEIRDGGISFIRVTDNGCGIPREEVALAFLRHSTSKIKSVEDLFTVASLGFRGEALSSIAAVSQVELITKTPDEISGTRYQIEGGKERSLEEIGAPEGTTFLVRNLFYNTPARQKFLKTAQTEGSHVAALVEKIAMSHPDISIRFIQNNQNKLHTSGNHNLKDIIYTVFGREIAANLLPVELEEEILQIRGFAGKPVIARNNRNFENYYINGRYIKSNLVARAIEEAYRPFMMQHKYPFVLLHLTIEPEYLDVNVHPTKMELRFRDGEQIYGMIYRAVSEALAHKELIPQVSLNKERKEEKPKRQENVRPEPFETKRRSYYAGKGQGENRAGTEAMTGGPAEAARTQGEAGAAGSGMPQQGENGRAGNGMVQPGNDGVAGNSMAQPGESGRAGNGMAQSGENAGQYDYSIPPLYGMIAEKQSPWMAGERMSPEADSADAGPGQGGQRKTEGRHGPSLAGGESEAGGGRASAGGEFGAGSGRTSAGGTSGAGSERASAGRESGTGRAGQAPAARASGTSGGYAPADRQHGSGSGYGQQTDGQGMAALETVLLGEATSAAPGYGTAADGNRNSDGLQLDLFEEKLLEPKSRLRHKLIGQLFETYWLVEFNDHLYIIDQHAAHEKVLYERTMATLKNREYTSQMVNPPIILTIGSEEQVLFEKYMSYFTEIGFEIEPFGGKEYAVRAVPDNLFSIARKELLLEMIDSLSDDMFRGNPDIIYQRVASMSCKAAVKGNNRMSFAEADRLIDQLLELENPYACPHGRPTIISMSKYELEKKFKRIV